MRHFDDVTQDGLVGLTANEAKLAEAFNFMSGILQEIIGNLTSVNELHNTLVMQHNALCQDHNNVVGRNTKAEKLVKDSLETVSRLTAENAALQAEKAALQEQLASMHAEKQTLEAANIALTAQLRRQGTEGGLPRDPSLLALIASLRAEVQTLTAANEEFLRCQCEQCKARSRSSLRE